MTVITPAGATIPGVTHHLADVNGTRLHYVLGRHQRLSDPARPRLAGVVVGLPQADPAAGADAPGLRRGPARLR